MGACVPMCVHMRMHTHNLIGVRVYPMYVCIYIWIYMGHIHIHIYIICVYSHTYSCMQTYLCNLVLAFDGKMPCL